MRLTSGHIRLRLQYVLPIWFVSNYFLVRIKTLRFLCGKLQINFCTSSLQPLFPMRFANLVRFNLFLICIWSLRFTYDPHQIMRFALLLWHVHTLAFSNPALQPFSAACLCAQSLGANHFFGKSGPNWESKQSRPSGLGVLTSSGRISKRSKPWST